MELFASENLFFSIYFWLVLVVIVSSAFVPGRVTGVTASHTIVLRDIDNDGNNGLLLGASWADPEGRLQAGEGYTVLGLLPVTNVPFLTPWSLVTVGLVFGALLVITRRRRVGTLG